MIIITVPAYYLLNLWAQDLSREMGKRAKELGFLRTVVARIIKTTMDTGVVFIAWGLGYLAALYLHGTPGTLGIRQSLYLNAFLFVGLGHVFIRAVFSPRSGDLRLIDISDAAAKHASRWLCSIASVIGYGQLLIVPIVNRQSSMAAGRGISTILAFLAIGMTLTLVVKNRQKVANWILGDEPAERSGTTKFFAPIWYIPVVFYLLLITSIVAARPDGLIWPVIWGSAQVLVVIILGVLVSNGLSRVAISGVKIPSEITQRIPLLQVRSNDLLSKVIAVLRTFIAVAIVLFLLHSIGLLNVWEVMKSEFGIATAKTLSAVGFVILFGVITWLALASWVDYRLNPDYGSMPTARETTLLTLLRNAASITLIVIILMFVLSELGIDIAPLIASAGVLGLAIGFGAQKLVQDIITGIFIQFENAINVGDVVTLGNTTGAVEKLTIRSVTLRDVQGTVHLIPFSSVDMVSNYVKDFSFFVCDLGIAYREKVSDGKAAMLEAFELLKETDQGEFIQGDIEWFGVQSLGDSAVILRARIKCVPGKQWGVGRVYNELCKQVLDERQIEIPFPHQTIYLGVDKDGSAPALHIKENDSE